MQCFQNLQSLAVADREVFHMRVEIHNQASFAHQALKLVSRIGLRTRQAE